MEVPGIIELLNTAHQMADRSPNYIARLHDKVHPRFFSLVAQYQAGEAELHNNPLLQEIRIHLDNSLEQMNDIDLAFFDSILTQLAEGFADAEIIPDDPEFQDGLQQAENRYSEAMEIYAQLQAFDQQQQQVSKSRQQFPEPEPGTPEYDFLVEFDTELERDGRVVQFLKDSFRLYANRLYKFHSLYQQVAAWSGSQLPDAQPPKLKDSLEQLQMITSRVNAVNSALQEAQARLADLGQKLQNGQTDPDTAAWISQVSADLDVQIGIAPGDSDAIDELLNQVQLYTKPFRIPADASEIEGLAALAEARRAEAKAARETAHVLKVAFAGFDTICRQLDSANAPPDVRDMYSLYRMAIDKFHLVSVYTDTLCGKYEFSIDKIWDRLKYLLSDPHTKLWTVSDQLPFALLPVRLETRFMTIKHVRDNIEYASPYDVLRSDDDAAEIKSIKYKDTLEATASPFTGTQLHISDGIDNIPDKHELWVRIYPDNIAIHTHEPALSQSELNDAQVYWTEVWKGLGDTNYELGAWRVLCASYGPQRAAWIVSQTTPTNGPNPNTGTAPLASLTTPPTLPALSPRPASWSQKPVSRVMPDRFVARVYSNNTWREVPGQSIPSPLPVGFDPMDPYTNYLDQYGAEINMPPELRWLTNFEEAEKVGMGIRIPLQVNELTQGFDRLLVLGVNLSLTAEQSAAELETLMNNHHYASGLALVPQGTPTNNTEEVKSGYAGLEPGYEESFKTELGAPLFNTTANHYDKADGQRLAEALGLDASVFQHVANAGTFDIQESMTMTRALWSGTLGYYLKNMLTPAIVQSDITNTKSFFTDYVQGRGLIPAFRVRNQPYGVLTSTAYSRWRTSGDAYGFDAKLHEKILDKLRRYWLLHFCDDVKRVTAADPDPDKLIVDILGLHPASLQFHQRITIGSILSSNMAQFMAAANLQLPNPPIANPSAENLLDVLYRSYMMENFTYFNIPRIFSMAFSKSQRLLNGPVIDSLPLSEKRPVENVQYGYANYIEWLAQSPIDYIRDENFTNVQQAGQQQAIAPPKALLYLLLRHAWLLDYLDTAHCLLTQSNIISVDAWHNHELVNMTGGIGPDMATEEQKNMLHGFVKAEVQYENEVQIEDVMRNIYTNQEFLDSGMTVKQFHQLLRDRSAHGVEIQTGRRYKERLGVYAVEQAQWSYLTSVYPELTKEMAVGDYIRSNINSGNPCYADIRQTQDALNKLKTLPTARLERLLAEHLDTCTYRLDAWLNGELAKRLHQQRTNTPNGIYLGAYGILENPKPGNFPGIHVVNVSEARSWKSATAKVGQRKMLDLTPVGKYPENTNGTYITPLPPYTQPASFIYLGEDVETRLIEDPESGKIVAGQRVNPDNKGFILAPSLNHAVAAAVLRAGYVAHKNSGALGKTMAVGLSSDRVRTAMYYLDGVRNGQSLAALLGYRFERGLHERQSSVVQLDGYIYELRKKYPLVSGAVIATPTSSSDVAQSRHVTDGLQLLEAAKSTTNPPFWYTGIAGLDNGASPTADGALIALEIDKIKDDLDAIGDLLLSESIYQVTRGNHERAGAVLQALGYGGSIPEPEIIKTLRQADTFTHRCAVQLTPAVTANSVWTASSARADAEPALNNWLASQLPAATDICISYNYAGNSATLWADMNALQLQPIDLLAIFNTMGNSQSADASELSKRIILYARDAHNKTDDVEITIDYRSRAGFASMQRTLFELTPVLQSLSRIVGNSRMLNPDDFVTPGALSAMTSPAGALDSAALLARLDAAFNTLSAIANDLKAITPTPNPATTIRDKAYVLAYNGSAPANANAANTALAALRKRLMDAAAFGLGTAVPDTQSDNTKEVRNQLVGQADRAYAELSQRVATVNPKLADVTTAIAAAQSSGDHKACVNSLIEIARLLFGRAFKVFTNFTLHNPAEVQAAANYTSLLNDAGPYPVEAWMTGVARVRPRVGDYHKQMLLAESLRYDPTAMAPFAYTKQTVLQLPVVDASATASDRWIGMKLPAGYKIPLDAVSMVLESDGSSTVLPDCGMVIDEWAEQIPLDQVTTGISINYDQPSSEAPQAILLAVTPAVKNYWDWTDLMETLNETIDMARIRAVEPDMIQKSPLSQVLPALVAQMSGDGTNVSPSLDFARNVTNVPAGFNDPIDTSAY